MNELDSIFDDSNDDDIFGEDSVIEQENQQPSPEPSNYVEPKEFRELDSIFDDVETTNSNNTALDQYLQSKGFKNSEITIYDENDKEVKVNFHELSEEEKFDVLSSITTKEQGFSLRQDEQE